MTATDNRPVVPGRAVDDEDPDGSPMVGTARPEGEPTGKDRAPPPANGTSGAHRDGWPDRGPAQPIDVDRVEDDRARSTGRPPLAQNRSGPPRRSR